MQAVYGDYPHANDGRHLDGGVATDAIFQHLWKRVVQLPLRPYEPPRGRVGKRFVATLAGLLRGVRERKHNAEKFIVFRAVIAG